MSKIKLNIDIVNGKLELECASDDFDEIMERVEELMRGYADTASGLVLPLKASPSEEEPQEAVVEAPKLSGSTSPSKKPRRRKGGSHSANWKVVDDLLTDGQRVDLKQFFEQKAPSTQNDKVAVLSFKLQEVLKRDGFDGNEIHTAFQAVGEKTPASLSGVLGNMATADMGKMVDSKWTPNFKSNDRVKHDLPIASKT